MQALTQDTTLCAIAELSDEIPKDFIVAFLPAALTRAPSYKAGEYIEIIRTWRRSKLNLSLVSCSC